jgi:hypothetical protein
MTAETPANGLGARRVGSGWMAPCPAHDDRTPSLSIGDAGSNKVLVRCHAGCDQDRVIDTFVKPDDVRLVPRRERIISVYEDGKFDRLTLESGDRFGLNQTNTRSLAKVFGRDSDGWRGRGVELSLDHYKEKDSDETKETVVATPIGATQEQNGGATPQQSRREDMDDEIPF